MQQTLPFKKRRREIPGLLIIIIVLTLIPAILSPFFRKGESEKTALVDKAAPALSFQDRDGKANSLAALKGKVVLLNYWASWCAPCMAEMDQLRQLEGKYFERGFRMVALNLDEKAKDLGKIIDDPTLPRGLFFEMPPEELEAYAVHSIPQSFLVDANGVIRKHYRGAKDWTGPSILKEIEALLPAVSN